MSGIFVVGAKRTPFGSFGGSLKKLTGTELGVLATKAALSDANIDDANIVDNVIFGNVVASSPDAPYTARHIALQSGCNQSIPSLTINRLCGSGFESIIQGYNLIALSNNHNNPIADPTNVVVCGGTENMSMAPYTLNGNDVRWGTALGSALNARDSLWDGLTDMNIKLPMGITAENLAQKYNISRLHCDEIAVRSQNKYGTAKEDNVFDAEIVPVDIYNKKTKQMEPLSIDEHPRPGTLVEKIGQLKPVFNPKDGVVTAANASGICDGAGALIVASEHAMNEHNLTPLARIVSYAVTGCDPKIMGIGPVSAIQQALNKINITSLDEIDRIEINEAFAAQFIACIKELSNIYNISEEELMIKSNLHGGAIAMGHPLAASGSRISAHLVHEFKSKPNNKYHIGAACIGGGQGIAIVFEKV